MKPLLRIALAQVLGRTDPRANLEVAHEATLRAQDASCDLIVFPEMFMGLPTKKRPPLLLAREWTETFLEDISVMAKNRLMAIVTGFWDSTMPHMSKVYNAAAFFNISGQCKTIYRKIHLFDALDTVESETMLPGDDPPPVISYKGWGIGLAICYDLRFPELFRYLTDAGAHLIVVVAAWYQGPMKEDHWLTLLRARAIENTCFVAGCNLVGRPFCGRSALFDPFGVPMVSAGEDETLLVADLPLNRLVQVRERLPCLEHRRRRMWMGHGGRAQDLDPVLPSPHPTGCNSRRR